MPLMRAGSHDRGFWPYGISVAPMQEAPSVCGRDGEVVEVDVAVRLRPQADAARHRRRQGVLEIELAIEIALDLGAGDADLQVVPLAARRRRVPNPLHGRALAFLKLPEDQIVLEAVGPNGQVVAIGLEIEQNAGALVDPAGDALEANGNLSRSEIRHVLGNRVGEVGIGLNAVEKLRIALAVE